MQIGELAKKTNCTVQTIRLYERSGLLRKPPRSSGNYRTYNGAALERLIFIRQCRALGITIKEIALLLRQRETPKDNCDGVSKLISKHLSNVQRKINELQELQITLKRLSNECPGNNTVQTFGIFNKLEAN